MFDIQLILVICSIDYQTGEYYFLSLNKDKINIPQIELSNTKSIDQSISEIFYSSCLYDINWSSTKLVKCINNNNVLSIIYMSKIPYTNIDNRFWTKCKFGYIIYPFIKDCIAYV